MRISFVGLALITIAFVIGSTVGLMFFVLGGTPENQQIGVILMGVSLLGAATTSLGLIKMTASLKVRPRPIADTFK